MRVLLLAYFFPPAKTVGVVRIATLVKYWTRAGVDVTVLRADDLLGAGPDAGRDFSPPPGATVVVAPTWPASSGLTSSRAMLKKTDFATPRHTTRPSRNPFSFARAGRLARRVRDHLLIPDVGILWLRSALRTAARLHTERPFDVVFASGNPWSNLVTANAIAHRLKIPLVADFRDPWADGPLYSGRAGWTAPERMAHARLERWVCRDAAFVSATTKKIGAAIAGRHVLRNAPQIIENGFDPEDMAGVLPSSDPTTFRIVMTSSFRAGERFVDFLRALRRSVDSRLMNDRRVTFSFAGRSRAPGEPTSIADYFRNAGISGVLDERGFLPRAEALALQRSADLLLFLETPFQSVPGGMVGTEFYEYLSTGRRILLLDDADSAVWDVGARAGTVRLQEREDVAGITAAIGDAMSGLWEPRPDWSWINRFARDAQAARFLRVLESATLERA